MKNNIYVISDSHFGHSKMEKWSLRPDDFEEKIWKGLDTIPDDGLLIHCGDITLGQDATVHNKLREYKFKKWLIRGNHDIHSITWYLRNGWDFIGDEIVLDVFGGKILFSHCPLPVREGFIKNIHGHLHGSKSHERPDFYKENYHIEVTPEVVGYQPVKLQIL